MCGIVGLLLKKPALRPQLGELMLPMLIGMTERGPDSAGMAVFTEPVAAGFCKLSLYSGGGAAGARFDWAALLSVRLVAAGEVDEVMTWDRLRAAYGGKLALLPDTAFAARAG